MGQKMFCYTLMLFFLAEHRLLVDARNPFHKKIHGKSEDMITGILEDMRNFYDSNDADEDTKLQDTAKVALGCFEDTSADRALPIQLGDLRVYIDWSNFAPTIASCAALAEQKGYKVFAVQNYGECWSGPDAKETYNKHGAATTCYEGVGMTSTNYVYELSD